MDKLKLAEQTIINDEYPEFKTGDTVNVHYRVREGDKERIQQYEGLVISRKGSGANKTFMVRKISAGNIGVERVFPLYSPFIAKIELKKQGSVRRSKLYYLRERRGKSARIKEKGQNQNNVRELNRQAEAKAKAAQKAKASAEEE
jgi:large subunit ribosomal protein L19